MTDEQFQNTLQSKSVAQRSAVVAAGPIANFILTIVIFAVIFAVSGRPMTKPLVDAVMAGTAAEEAGFQAGDLVKMIDGDPIKRFNDIRLRVSLNAGSPMNFVVERNGKDVALTATPRMQEVKGPFGGSTRMGVLGIQRRSGRDGVIIEQFSPTEAIVEGVSETWQAVKQTGAVVWGLIRGRQDASQIGGPIMIAKISGQAASQGSASLFTVIAILSVSIGLLNLLPIPMLDGGHLMFYLAEALMGRPVSEKVQDIGFRIGFALVMMLMIFVTWNDVSRQIQQWLSS